VLKYLDESGFSLCLPPTSGWTRKGQAHQHRVPTRWGSKGRLNLIGTMCPEEGGAGEPLEYAMIEGPCRSAEVMGYLDALAEEAQKTGKKVVVVMDNAPFHTAGTIRERERAWEELGLRLYRLPRLTARTLTLSRVCGAG
jgi:putative transposase